MDSNASPTLSGFPSDPFSNEKENSVKEMEEKTPSGQPIIDREKTAPFLIRAFVKTGSFHRLAQFQDGPLPIVDELQIFTWKDATLYELLTTIRNSAPSTVEYRHPLAR